MSDFTHILAQFSGKLIFFVQLELFWLSVIFVGVKKNLLTCTYCFQTIYFGMKNVVIWCSVGNQNKTS